MFILFVGHLEQLWMVAAGWSGAEVRDLALMSNLEGVA